MAEITLEPFALGLRVKVVGVMVAGFIASLKVTTTVFMGGTFEAFWAGTVLKTAGITVSTVHVHAAGVLSTLPAASVAPTWKVCTPFVKPL